MTQSAPQERTLEERVRAIEDRAAIIDLLCRYAVGIDRRLWDDFASCFAEEVDLSVIRTRGAWVRWTRADLVARLRTVFESYTATQHLRANHQVEGDGDTAVAWSTLNATHYLRGTPGGELQQQVGYYEHRLVRTDGWRIASVRQVEHWQHGNQQIFERTVT